MRVDVRLGAALLAVVAVAVACNQPAPLPVAAREPALDAGDLAVIRALIDNLVRPSEGRPAPHVLLVDTTLAVCDRDPRAFGAPPGGCLDGDWVTHVAGVLPPGSARTARLAFEARNARRLPIQGPLGGNVTFVSTTLVDSLPESRLLADHPPRSQVVTLSAPVYPSSRVAVTAFRAVGINRNFAGAARLERRMNGFWSVVATADIRSRE